MYRVQTGITPDKALIRAEVIHRSQMFSQSTVDEDDILDSPRFIENAAFENSRLKLEMLRKNDSKEFIESFEKRRNLPCMQKCIEILETIKEYQVVNIVAKGRIGKSTQIPQLLLDDYIFNNRGSECRIVCMKGINKNAIHVAECVAKERNEKLGQSIGFQTSKEIFAPRKNGSILFCTPDCFAKMFHRDPFLYEISSVVLDDMHFQTLEYKLIMELLSLILPYRRDLQVITLSRYSDNNTGEYFKDYHQYFIDETLDERRTTPEVKKDPRLTAENFEDIDMREHSDVHQQWNSFGNSSVSTTAMNSYGLQPQTSRYKDSQPNSIYFADAHHSLKSITKSEDSKYGKSKDEYKRSLQYLWGLMKVDAGLISTRDKALIKRHVQSAKQFEKDYPDSASQSKGVGIFLQKFKKNVDASNNGQQNVKARIEPFATTSKEDKVAEIKYTKETEAQTGKPKMLSTQIESDLEVAVVDMSDPDGKILPERWLLIEEKLLTEMTADKWSNEVISFNGADWSDGIKVISCGNRKSLVFLKATIVNIGRIWPMAKLRVVPRSTIPLRTFVKMWIPPPVPSMAHVFELLGKQNQGLVSDEWQIISSAPCKNDYGMLFRIAIDNHSLKRLRECQGRARFGFGFINIQEEEEL